MTGYLEWFTASLSRNLSSAGCRALLLKAFVFMAVEFGLLYSMYAGRLEHPLSAALMPVLQQFILLGIFLLFSWSTIAELPAFPLNLRRISPFLAVAVLLVLYRMTLTPGAPLNRLATGIALICFFFVVFGLNLLRHLMHGYQRQVMFTAIAFLYFLYVLTIEGESLTRALNMILWAK